MTQVYKVHRADLYDNCATFLNEIVPAWCETPLHPLVALKSGVASCATRAYLGGVFLSLSGEPALFGYRKGHGDVSARDGEIYVAHALTVGAAVIQHVSSGHYIIESNGDGVSWGDVHGLDHLRKFHIGHLNTLYAQYTHLAGGKFDSSSSAAIGIEVANLMRVHGYSL